MKRHALCVLLAALVTFLPVHTLRAIDDYSPEAIVTDTLIVRPATFVVTVFGSVMFVVALPFAAISKSVGTTADSLVTQPAKATFTRRLGNFTDLK
jgi:hypothetical protein